MTFIDKIYTRSETEKSYLYSNLKRLNNAVKADLLFSVDEYITSIFNTFFSDNRSIAGDESILNEFIKLSKNLSLVRNDDKKNKTAIYGTTTPEEREELYEEGTDLLSIPWVNKDN